MSAHRSRPPRAAHVLAPIVAVASIASIAAAGCTTFVPGRGATPVYEREAFASRDAFSREFVATPADTCNAARRALLSQGYVVDAGRDEQMSARKRFQPEPDTHVLIEFNVVCSPVARGQPATVAFASAVQDRYTVRKTSTSASVGVGPFGSLSVPLPSGADSMVKVGSETIPPGRFYDRFFDLVEQFLAEQQGLEEPPARGPRGAASPS